MQTIRVAAVSMNGEFNKQQQVLERIADFCEQAVSENAELVLFPELIVHGHCTPNNVGTCRTGTRGPEHRSTCRACQAIPRFPMRRHERERSRHCAQHPGSPGA